MSRYIHREEAAQVVEQIIKRAQSDSEFRQLCLSNPNDAAKTASGKEIPEGYVLRFVENQGADLTVVLPDLVNESAELSDKELERVAGGKCAVSCAATGPGTCICVGVPSVTGV